MNRGWAVAFFFVVGARVALAAGYDDFSRGLNANNRGDIETAISSFSAALAAGDLAPTYVPNAYLGRARAYLGKKECADALSDLDVVLKLKAGNVDALFMRAGANVCLNKPDAAQADFDFAVGQRPTSGAYENFAHSLWNYGLFAQAAENYAHAIKFAANNDRRKPYLVLWYAMSAGRIGPLDTAALAADVSALESSTWPTPVLDFYLGKIRPDEVYKSATSWNSETAANQKCEADFYIAEWQLARKNRDDAKSLLLVAKNECPHDFFEYSAAGVELKRLQ